MSPPCVILPHHSCFCCSWILARIHLSTNFLCEEKVFASRLPRLSKLKNFFSSSYKYPKAYVSRTSFIYLAKDDFLPVLLVTVYTFFLKSFSLKLLIWNKYIIFLKSLLACSVHHPSSP